MNREAGRKSIRQFLRVEMVGRMLEIRRKERET